MVKLPFDLVTRCQSIDIKNIEGRYYDSMEAEADKDIKRELSQGNTVGIIEYGGRV